MDYKKILEDVVDIINTTEKSDIGFANICTYIGENCPELKESEGEMIRKDIERAISVALDYSYFDKETANNCLAWIEKQGEYANFRNKIQIGDKVTRNKDGVLVNMSQLNRVAKIDEKQGEQSKNEDKDILHRFSFYSYKDEPNILYLAGLYVDDEYRNKGIGTKILKVANEVAASIKCNSIRLKTEKGSHAEKLYRENGYTTIFEEENQIWLEKQAEQNPVDTVEHNIPHLTDFENAVKDMMNDYREAIGDNDATIEEIKELATYLLSLIHQRPTWSEEDEEIYQSIMDDTVQENQLNDKQTNWLRDIKCRYFPQPKQEWKQENTGDLNDFENAMMHIGNSFFGQHAGLDPNNTNAIKEQANLLLELVPNKEWSKEDENNILFLTSIIEEYFKDKENITLCGDTNCANFTKENVINRLKSLRPQNTWKPSESDILLLEKIANGKSNPQDFQASLWGLIGQLKKLRE